MQFIKTFINPRNGSKEFRQLQKNTHVWKIKIGSVAMIISSLLFLVIFLNNHLLGLFFTGLGVTLFLNSKHIANYWSGGKN